MIVDGRDHDGQVTTSSFNAGARRWAVLSEDGRYVTMGRATDPTSEEITRIEDAMQAQGLTGWLAVMEGSPHSGLPHRMMEVRAIGVPAVAFADAVALATAVTVASVR